MLLIFVDVFHEKNIRNIPIIQKWRKCLILLPFSKKIKNDKGLSSI